MSFAEFKLDSRHPDELFASSRHTHGLLVLEPGRAGLDILRTIRSEAELASTKVILLTASAQQSDLIFSQDGKWYCSMAGSRLHRNLEAAPRVSSARHTAASCRLGQPGHHAQRSSGTAAARRPGIANYSPKEATHELARLFPTASIQSSVGTTPRFV